jgi:hypothetical protein
MEKARIIHLTRQSGALATAALNAAIAVEQFLAEVYSQPVDKPQGARNGQAI